ncbi:putative redox protein [Ereboglobus sp. PH5-5]|uniref:OsmC family protein n=1 Tax=unclassified Ereboglobus TaxID=2626932 RepID=UPI002405D2B6|nr:MULTISPECIES: OsmC family protein [unclassified Ereboglobus]MDF9828553.1 putative redox protein [Ereboglobus sp. PH5-10]MDF9832455.1 putative redox protein [Ereboglobus sp. PH5-5]
MVKITGEYQGELHCVAKHEQSGNTLVTDAPRDNNGRGEAFSPTDLAATALGTCMLTIMAMAARKHGVELKGTRFEVVKEMSTNLPRRIASVDTKFWVPFRKDALPGGTLERAAESCPVHQSLHPDIKKQITFYWAE